MPEQDVVWIVRDDDADNLPILRVCDDETRAEAWQAFYATRGKRAIIGGIEITRRDPGTAVPS